IRDNNLLQSLPLATENEGYPVRSVLAFPMMEERKPVGALVLVNKRGRLAEFTAEDQELLLDLSRQAVRALRNARQYEAEKQDDGTIQTDRPETEEKFRAFFEQTGFRAFHGLLLNDEEGKLGVLAFFRKKPLVLDEDARDLVAILVNQATVAVRNAQLYKQITL